MKGGMLFVASLMSAASAPCLVRVPASVTAPFPGWPSRYEGRLLTPVLLPARDRGFAADFPGRVQTFTDGRRTLILRFIAEPTRRLHPAVQCFEGAGYEIAAAADGFLVRRDGRTRLVRERIVDGGGRTWSEVGAWYWSALLGRTRGPWWSVTTVDEVVLPGPRLPGPREAAYNISEY
jgi:hypothetical protein